jgi:hypothetical protein
VKRARSNESQPFSADEFLLTLDGLLSKPASPAPDLD